MERAEDLYTRVCARACVYGGTVRCTRMCGVRLSARAAAATIIRWGFRIASGGLAPIVVTSIRPMKIPGYTGCPRPTAWPLSHDYLDESTVDYPYARVCREAIVRVEIFEMPVGFHRV